MISLYIFQQIETEFDATMKALEEERNKLSAQLDLMETEKKALQEDRKKFEKEHKNLKDEKTQLTEMATQIKRRSKEIESLFSVSLLLLFSFDFIAFTKWLIDISSNIFPSNWFGD